MGMDSAHQVDEQILAVALPVAAVDEDEAGRVGVGGREEIPAIALARPVAHVEMPGVGAPELGRLGFALGIELGAVLNRQGVVVGRIALGLGHHSPVHSVPLWSARAWM